MSLGMRINNISWFRGAIRTLRFTPRALGSAELLPPTAGAAALAAAARASPLPSGDSGAGETPEAAGPPSAGLAAPDAAAIEALLQEQVAAWNAADLEGFMAGYWESEDLVFTSGGAVRRGFAATLAGYRERYSAGGAGGTDAASMGLIRVDMAEVTTLGPDAAWVLGRVVHTIGGSVEAGRPNRVDGVSFTLVLRRVGDVGRWGGWRIVHDHSSTEAPPQAKAAL